MWAAAVGAAVTAVILMFAARTPSLKLYPGDRTEIRDCRTCAGSGSGPQGRCRSCDGKRRVTVILPGGNHPWMVRGTVLDSAAPAPPPPSDKPGLTSVPGAIKGARLTFTSGSTPTETMVGLTGRFKVLLAPGTYKVHIEAKGYAPLDTEYALPPATEPVWQEAGKPVSPPDRDDAVFRVSR